MRIQRTQTRAQTQSVDARYLLSRTVKSGSTATITLDPTASGANRTGLRVERLAETSTTPVVAFVSAGRITTAALGRFAVGARLAGKSVCRARSTTLGTGIRRIAKERAPPILIAQKMARTVRMTTILTLEVNAQLVTTATTTTRILALVLRVQPS
jgi:hypothetical protein